MNLPCVAQHVEKLQGDMLFPTPTSIAAHISTSVIKRNIVIPSHIHRGSAPSLFIPLMPLKNLAEILDKPGSLNTIPSFAVEFVLYHVFTASNAVGFCCSKVLCQATLLYLRGELEVIEAASVEFTRGLVGDHL